MWCRASLIERFIRGENCLEWLQDLQRALRRDDDLHRAIAVKVSKQYSTLIESHCLRWSLVIPHAFQTHHGHPLSCRVRRRGFDAQSLTAHSLDSFRAWPGYVAYLFLSSSCWGTRGVLTAVCPCVSFSWLCRALVGESMDGRMDGLLAGWLKLVHTAGELEGGGDEADPAHAGVSR
jgi:hypothetical protein